MDEPNQKPNQFRVETYQVEVREDQQILLEETYDIVAPGRPGTVALMLQQGTYLVRVRRYTGPLPKGGDVDPMIEVWRY